MKRHESLFLHTRYDVFNRLISEHVEYLDDSGYEHTEWYLYDGQNQIAVLGGAGGSAAIVCCYLRGPEVDQVLAADYGGGQVAWYLSDNQGTIRDVLNYDPSTFQTTVAYHACYDAYGNITNPGYALPFAYAGQMLDPETGLYCDGDRWYDAGVGRFLSDDPTGFSAGDTNLQRYVFNDPVNLVDPTGEVVANVSPMQAAILAAASAPNAPAAPQNTSTWVWPWDPNASWNPLDTFSLWTGLRTPDYVCGNVNVAIPNPYTLTLVGVTGQVSMDRYGNLYWGPGVTVGKSATMGSGSLTAGWLNQAGTPNQNQMQDFLSSNSFNAGGGYWVGAQETWTPGCGTATEVGIFSPQVGGSWHYSWQKGNSGLNW